MLGLFFLTCYPFVFHNQALADVRSTGAGIRFLYRSKQQPSAAVVVPAVEAAAVGRNRKQQLCRSSSTM